MTRNTSNRQPNPLDLRTWWRTSPPKLKKDYPGRYIMLENHGGRYGYNRSPEHNTIPDPCVLQIARRAADFNNVMQIVGDWECPCCGAAHRQEIPETVLAEGGMTFVTENPDADDILVTRPQRRVIYLACPYSDDNPHIRQQRWIDACDAAVELMRMGYAVLSPISMGHPIAHRGQDEGIGGDWPAWQAACLAMMEGCTSLAVLKLAGWERSKGVHAEVEQARRMGLPIYAMTDLDNGYNLNPEPNLRFAGGAE